VSDQTFQKKGLRGAGGCRDSSPLTRLSQVSAQLRRLLRTAEEQQTFGRLTLQIGLEEGRPVSLHSEVRESIKFIPTESAGAA
jgi:hypothetical protein